MSFPFASPDHYLRKAKKKNDKTDENVKQNEMPVAGTILLTSGHPIQGSLEGLRHLVLVQVFDSTNHLISQERADSAGPDSQEKPGLLKLGAAPLV